MKSGRAAIAGAAVVVLLAVALRGLWLTADPATSLSTNVGVVWHDEGAWVHNARNHALWGTWRTDEWNPMYIAPVFTGLEAAAFGAFGVGTWQARTVPLASGLIAIVALMWGLWAIAGRNAALIGGLLLATNYTFVMWNRAALMESTMTMFIVVGWAAYARAFRQPRWGVLAGVAVVLAFFTKAAAAFFVAAIGVELAMAWWVQGSGFRVQGPGARGQRSGSRVQG
jgi:4-amino-4-deoxy-L-arabinose transferase-like glycosyltransferase